MYTNAKPAGMQQTQPHAATEGILIPGEGKQVEEASFGAAFCVHSYARHIGWLRPHAALQLNTLTVMCMLW